MANNPHFSPVCGGSEPRLDVLFVHGLTGDALETWTVGGGTEYWPKWLCDDLDGVSVYTLGYPASIFAKWARKEMNLHERANNLLEHLAAGGIGTRPIALVCHSLGGILAKEMLRTSNECADAGWKPVAQQTRLAVFMATPHTGAALGSVVKLIAPRLASTHIDLLSNDSGYLTSLNQSYRDLANSAGIATVSYYEKFKTKGTAIVISPESADPGVGSIRPVPQSPRPKPDAVSSNRPRSRRPHLGTSFARG